MITECRINENIRTYDNCQWTKTDRFDSIRTAIATARTSVHCPANKRKLLTVLSTNQGLHTYIQLHRLLLHCIYTLLTTQYNTTYESTHFQKNNPKLLLYNRDLLFSMIRGGFARYNCINSTLNLLSLSKCPFIFSKYIKSYMNFTIPKIYVSDLTLVLQPLNACIIFLTSYCNRRKGCCCRFRCFRDWIIPASSKPTVCYFADDNQFLAI